MLKLDTFCMSKIVNNQVHAYNILNSFYQNTEYNYIYNYENLSYEFYQPCRYLHVIINPNKLINDDPSPRKIIKAVNDRLIDIIPYRFKDFNITRADICCDNFVKRDLKPLYLKQYERIEEKCHYHNKYTTYESSKYYNMGKTKNMIIYDKEEEQKAKFKDIDLYLDVMRVEFRMYKQFIKNQKSKNNLVDIYKIFDTQFQARFVYQFYKNIIYQGNYIKFIEAKHIIKDSTRKDYSKNLINFIALIRDKSLIEAREIYKSKFYKYINVIQNLNINPYLLPDESPVQKLTNFIDFQLLKNIKDT